MSIKSPLARKRDRRPDSTGRRKDRGRKRSRPAQIQQEFADVVQAAGGPEMFWSKIDRAIRAKEVFERMARTVGKLEHLERILEQASSISTVLERRAPGVGGADRIMEIAERVRKAAAAIHNSEGSAKMQRLAEEALRGAEQFRRVCPNWIQLHNVLFGVGGVLSKLFPTEPDRTAFSQRPEFRQIMDMIADMRTRSAQAGRAERTDSAG